MCSRRTSRPRRNRVAIYENTISIPDSQVAIGGGTSHVRNIVKQISNLREVIVDRMTYIPCRCDIKCFDAVLVDDE